MALLSCPSPPSQLSADRLPGRLELTKRCRCPRRNHAYTTSGSDLDVISVLGVPHSRLQSIPLRTSPAPIGPDDLCQPILKPRVCPLALDVERAFYR